MKMETFKMETHILIGKWKEIKFLYPSHLLSCIKHRQIDNARARARTHTHRRSHTACLWCVRVCEVSIYNKGRNSNLFTIGKGNKYNMYVSIFIYASCENKIFSFV